MSDCIFTQHIYTAAIQKRTMLQKIMAEEETVPKQGASELIHQTGANKGDIK